MVRTGSAAELAELCRRAEATGADSLWAVDHLFWPHPIGEALTTLAVAAAATTAGRTSGPACSSSPCASRPPWPSRPPPSSSSRAGASSSGWASGSHQGEYERAGVDFHRRGRLMDEGIAELRARLGRPRRRTSDYVQEPASTRVPLWFGGSSVAGPAPGGHGRRRLDPPLPHPRGLRGGAGGAPARDGRGRPRPGRRRAGRRGLRLRRATTRTRRAGRRLALAPLPAARQGLPAAPGGRPARDVRRRRCAASPTPGRATSSSWWPAPPPSSSSRSLRAGVRRRREQPGPGRARRHERDRRRHPRHRHDRHEPA